MLPSARKISPVPLVDALRRLDEKGRSVQRAVKSGPHGCILKLKTGAGPSWLGLFLDSSVIDIAHVSTLRVMHETRVPRRNTVRREEPHVTDLETLANLAEVFGTLTIIGGL